jgi:AhpD family alkylhydroperoxidase
MPVRDLPFLRQVRHVDPTTRDPRTSAVRRQIVQDFGMLPPFALHLPAPDALCAYWAIFRETTYGQLVERSKKEAVAAAVSAINACPYCVDVHTTMLGALGDRDPAAAIASGNTDGIADPDLRAIVAWARANRQPDAPILQQPPFADEHAPELIGVALAYHYINRMVNIFAAASPFPLGALKIEPLVRRAALPFFRRLLAREVRPGASLDLLPPAPLPGDLAWAQGDPIIADAFGRAAAAFDTVAQPALPAQVQQLLLTRLSAWRGEDPGISRGWVEIAIETLPEPHRPLGRLALLAAFASYQVDAQVLNHARTRPGPAGDQALIAAAAWASFAAARRIGSWLYTTPALPSNGRDLTPAGHEPPRPRDAHN